MIRTLYPLFQKWSENGSIWIISDTHFEDPDCKLMDENWPSPEEYIEGIKGVGKNDTVIHLGDVGNAEWISRIKGYKVLIMGNHDESASRFKDYFHEIYTGPLTIAEKIILSHEPMHVRGMLNIHGHEHNKDYPKAIDRFNCAANVVGYKKINLATDIINKGYLSQITSLHRQAIEKQKHPIMATLD